ncbi:hypothetical protein R1sor_026799 [Riccia sorocarpa]|uniref:Uncharacterized protein n=1 Tax=Riccia sorocarpa TaxID=122646 RepID=A0ABD3GDY8_9MARC
MRETRYESFTTLTKTVKPDQDRSIGEKPTEEEVERTAKLLKNDKSPGLDGLTTEALICCWSFRPARLLCHDRTLLELMEITNDIRTTILNGSNEDWVRISSGNNQGHDQEV